MKIPECKKHNTIDGRHLIYLSCHRNNLRESYNEFIFKCGCIIHEKILNSTSGKLTKKAKRVKSQEIYTEGIS